MVGGDAGDRAVAKRLEQRLPVVVRAERRVHLHVRVERANGLVGEDEVVRRHLGGRLDPARVRRAQRVDRLPRGEVHQVQRPLLVAREREVALDHRALGDRRVRREAELGADGALVHLAVAGERRLLAVERELAARDRAVLERPAHQARPR